VDVRLRTLSGALVAAAALAVLTLPAAGEQNCANDFRSGKLYFAQKVYDKSVSYFKSSVELCPDKAEYRARYAIALAQYGSERMLNEYAGAVGQEPLLAEILSLFATSGAEFDSALAVDPKDKSNKKFTNENRQHFWVDHYNRGLKFAKDGKFDAASVEFHVARLIDPHESRAYQQGAVALINSDHKQAAAELVREGLALDPENAGLKKLLDSIYVDAANGLIDAADRLVRDTPYGTVAQAAADTARAAREYLDKVLVSRPDDPTLYFDMGLSYLTEGGALARGDTGEGVSPAAQESFRKAAGAFAKAAELAPPDGDTRDTHLNSLFNEIQAHLNAEDLDDAKRVVGQYLSLAPTDPAIWQFLAQVLAKQGDQEHTVMALVVSKSIAGKELPVAEAQGMAIKEELETSQQMGAPDAVYTYQETESGNQINAWLWYAKKTAIAFKLGLRVGEYTW
jgi:tetratricopeptide (TPR) repeat protein